MKRLLCMLLSVLMIVSLCACADKKGDKDQGKDQGTGKEDQATEQAATVEQEEIATAPQSGNEEPKEIGTLPIIFGDDEEKQDGSDSTPATSSTKNPETTTKKPSTTTKKPATTDKNDNSSSSTPILGSGDGTVVETPIIPFN